MFAGKTGRVIEHLATARRDGLRVIAVKHRLDNRYDRDRLSTHDGVTWDARAIREVGEILVLGAGFDVVGIDEAQFMGRPLVAVCCQLRERGATVLVAGINHDAWGQPFTPLPELMELADEVEELHVRCGCCGAPASFSQRITPIRDGQMVGGPGDYDPRCAACFEPLPGPAPVY